MRNNSWIYKMIAIIMALIVGGVSVIIVSNVSAPKSAYEIAQSKGYTGTVEEWLASLVGETGATGEGGVSAYQLAVEKGYKGTEQEWLESLVGKPGLDGANGKSSYEHALDNGFEGSLSDWLDSLVGKDGLNGTNGTDGKSAYELACDNGFDGTLTEWLASLVGADGTNGTDGKSAFELAVNNGYKGTVTEWLASLVGEAGTNGTDGKSAFELAADNGYKGTEKEWLASLVGAAGTNGKSAYELAVDNGYRGDVQTWLASLVGAAGKDGTNGTDGKDGKSAYELAVKLGYEGDEAEWIASLAGRNGTDGKSAYELALDNGFEGSLAEWLDSLVGEDGLNGTNGTDGKSAYELACDNGFDGTLTEWLASLVGADGTNGTNGTDGTNGKSAYELAVEKGYEGDLQDWLASLVGAKGEAGKSAYEIAVDNGYEGTEREWLDSLVGAKGNAGNGIASIEKTNTEGLVDTYTITYTNGETAIFTVTNGAQGIQGIQGEKGDDGHTPVITIQDGYWYVDGVSTGVRAEGIKGDPGNGISSIEKTLTEGLVDTYTITYTNGETALFTVTNGKDGESPEVTVEGGNWHINGVDTGVSAIGQTGNGISSIEKTSSEGLVDTYTITFTSGNTTTFDITVAAVWHTGDGAPTEVEGARVGDFYIDLITSDVYELMANGWSNITNIKGISVVDVKVEALYNAQGKYFERYTFTFSDGTDEVIDVYDDEQLHAIEAEEYYVKVSNDPTKIPDILLKVIEANSNVTYVPLESYMIMNINEVKFSTVGTYRAFIRYYNVSTYITIHILPEEPVPSDESYINETSIIWSQHNFGSLTGLYLHVVWDRPGVSPLKLALTDPAVTVTKADGVTITDLDRGKNLELLVTYMGHSETLNVYWMSDVTLKNAKVTGFRYIGDTVYLESSAITAEGVTYPDMLQYGYLVFDLSTAACSGKYIRAIDTQYDKILNLDTDEELGLGNMTVDTIADHNLSARLEPTVTSKYYFIENTIPVFIKGSGLPTIAATAVRFSDVDVTTSQYAVPDVDVTFHIDAYPYQVTVPLTAEMLVDPNVFKTEGYKDIAVTYRYGGALLTGTVYGVYIHDLARITDFSANKNNSFAGTKYYRYIALVSAEETMKCTRSSDIVPTIRIHVAYIRGYDGITIDFSNGSINWDRYVDTYLIEEQIIELNQSNILNIKYLDFSKAGRKEIAFEINGVERTVYIDFYNIETGVVESITYDNGTNKMNAIPSNITLYDIGYLYVDVSTMKLYDRYSGRWTEIADLNTLEDEVAKEIVTTDGRSIWLTLKSEWGQILYSYDNNNMSTWILMYTDPCSAGENDGPFFISDIAPHDTLVAEDLLFVIKNHDAMKLGTALKVVYHENVDGVIEKEIVVDEAFFDNYDLSLFVGSRVGTQSVKFVYEEHYQVAISVEIKPCADRFVRYENIGDIRDADGNVLELLVDRERELIGSKRPSSTSVSSYHAYFVAEALGDGKELVYITNMATYEAVLGSVLGENPTAETIRFNMDLLYQCGFKAAIIDHSNQTIELYEEDTVVYDRVDVSAVAGGADVEAYIRLDGDVAELKLIIDSNAKTYRFYYALQENGTVITVNDSVITSSLGYFYLVSDTSGDEPFYKAHVGRPGTRYSIDLTGIEGTEAVANPSIVLCDNNMLYMTYDGITPDGIMLMGYATLDSNRIYVYSQNIIAELDHVSRTARVVLEGEYEADISEVSLRDDIVVKSAHITKGVGLMTMTVVMTEYTGTADEKESTVVLEFRCFEFEDGKFDVYLTENNSYVTSSDREQFNNYYIELVDGVMVVKADAAVKRYDIDYSEFHAFPAGMDADSITEAYVEMNTRDSILSIYINGMSYYSDTYVYDPATNTLCFEDFEGDLDLRFSFEIVDEDTVKMYDLLPGEEYDLDASLYLTLSGMEAVINHAFVRLTNNGKCVIYAEISVYHSDSRTYVTETMKEIFDYRWAAHDVVIPLNKDGEPIGMCLRLVGDDTFQICYGDENTEALYFTEDGEVVIFYKSGVTSFNFFSDSSLEALGLCFYEYLDEDTVYIVSILGVGFICDIVDGVLYMNTDYVTDDDIFEEGIVLGYGDGVNLVLYKYKDSNEMIVKYLTEETGNGEEISEFYMRGEILGEDVYYSSTLAFIDLLIYHINGQPILCMTGT